MPVVDRYEISIEGILNGPPGANAGDIAKFQATLTTAAPVGTGGLNSIAVWPAGFVLQGYTVPIWEAKAYPYPSSGAGGQTRLYFHAEVTQIDDRELTDPALQADAERDFKWFVESASKKWYTDLQGKLAALNGGFAAVPAEQVRIRRFHWYLGDGGGG